MSEAMPEIVYRTGQAAKLLGVSSHHIRKLAETGIIEAEVSEGGQFKIPASEVERLLEEGIPPIPQRIESGTALSARRIEQNPQHPVSAQVQAERDSLSTAELRLQKRKIELEHAGVEDSFSAREAQRTAELEAEKRRDAQAASERARAKWVNDWLKYAHSLVPGTWRDDVRLLVYQQADAAVNELSMDRSLEINKAIVDAAVGKALLAYRRELENQRQQEILQQQKKWETLFYESDKQRVLNSIRELWDWTQEERDQAEYAVSTALDRIAIGASRHQLENAKTVALAPFVRDVKRRQEREEVERNEEADRQQIANAVESHLSYVDYPGLKEYDFSGGIVEEWNTAKRLKGELRPILLKRIVSGKLDSTDTDAVERFIQDWVDTQLDEENE